MKRLRTLPLMVISLVILANATLSYGGTDRNESRPLHDVYVVQFVFDGLTSDLLQAQIDAGKLPSLKEHFIEQGVSFKQALTVFPASAATAYQSFVTGLFPGNAGLPHEERFDRQKKRDVHYQKDWDEDRLNDDLINMHGLEDPDHMQLKSPTTLFELLRDTPTAAIAVPISRGASIVDEKKIPLRALWSTYVTRQAEEVDAVALNRLMKLFARSTKQIPRYSLVGLQSLGVVQSRNDAENPDIETVLAQFDHFLSDFFKLLSKRGIEEKTYIIVSSAHGIHTAENFMSLRETLVDAGTLVKPKNPRERDYTLVLEDDAVSVAELYLDTTRPEKRWKEKLWVPVDDARTLRFHPTKNGKSVDLIATLQNLKATDLMAIRNGEGHVTVVGKNGEGEIYCNRIASTEWCSYVPSPLKGDPLGYLSSPKAAKLCDGTPYPEHVWLEATAGERYPDAVVQLSQVFRSPRAGDAFIIPATTWEFRRTSKQVYGSLERQDMHIPLLIRGPEIFKGTFGAARSVDVYPMILKWFGLSDEEKVNDGRDPFAKATTGSDPHFQKLAALEHLMARGLPLNKMIDVKRFLSQNVARIVPESMFASLIPLARNELDRRIDLMQGLENLKAKLTHQRTSSRAPKVTLSRHVSDSLAIVNWTLIKTQQDIKRMESVLRILRHCEVPFKETC